MVEMSNSGGMAGQAKQPLQEDHAATQRTTSRDKCTEESRFMTKYSRPKLTSTR